jgi:hypothetical protein
LYLFISTSVCLSVYPSVEASFHLSIYVSPLVH